MDIPELVFTLHQPLAGAKRDRLHCLWDLGADTLLLIRQPREGLKHILFYQDEVFLSSDSKKD